MLGRTGSESDAGVIDVDVLLGHYPDRDGPTGTPETLRTSLAAHGVTRAMAAHLRAALFDVRSGNDQVLELASEAPETSEAPQWGAIGTVDLRDPLGAGREIDRLAELGVRAIRLFPVEQHVEADFPAVRHVAKRATEAGLLIISGGDIRRFWRPLRGARVIFCDTHFYHLGDFVVIARDEPGFHTTTRLLTSPDALEIVAAEVGVDRMVFGSRAPFYEPGVPRLRLRRSELTAEQVSAVLHGNARRLLGTAETGADR